MRFLNPVLLWTMLGSMPAVAASTTYTLLPADSHLTVLVRYDREALIAGHDHVVEASSFTGTVTWDPEDPSACKIQIGFPVTALVVDPPGARARAGLEGSTTEGDKTKIKANLEGKHQLQASRFPKINFTSSACAASGDTFRVTGPLSLHGVSYEVSASMKIRADGDTFSAQGSFRGDHSNWKFDPFSAFFGSLKNESGLAFTIDVKGRAP